MAEYTLKYKRGTLAEWVDKNPVLSEGEPGYEIDSGKSKVGDGVTHWNDLPYFGANNTYQNIDDHVIDSHPHPSYDDGCSLLLLYENAKV